VPVVGQRCPATGKVNVGLTSHWPCVTDLSGLSTYGLKMYGTLYLLPPYSLVDLGVKNKVSQLVMSKLSRCASVREAFKKFLD